MNIFAFSMNPVYVVLEHLVYKSDLWYACNCKIHNFFDEPNENRKKYVKTMCVVWIQQKIETKKLKEVLI